MKTEKNYNMFVNKTIIDFMLTKPRYNNFITDYNVLFPEQKYNSEYIYLNKNKFEKLRTIYEDINPDTFKNLKSNYTKSFDIYLGKFIIDYLISKEEYKNFINVHDELFPYQKYNEEYISLNKTKFEILNKTFKDLTPLFLENIKKEYKLLLKNPEHLKKTRRQYAFKYYHENIAYKDKQNKRRLNKYYEDKKKNSPVTTEINNV